MHRWLAIAVVALLSSSFASHAQDSNAFAGYIDLSNGMNLTHIGNMAIDSASRASGWGKSAVDKEAGGGERAAPNKVTTVVAASADASMARKLAGAYPAVQRKNVEQVFRGLLAGYAKIEQQFGIPKNDVAGAVAAFLASSYMGYHNIDFPDEHFKPLVAQLREIIGANPQFAAASKAEKREMYEQMAILGMFMAGVQMALKEQPNAQIAANMKQAAKGYLEQFLQTDADNVQIGAQGLSLANAAPAPQAEEPAPAPDAADPKPESAAPQARKQQQASNSNTKRDAANATKARFATAPNGGLKPSQIVGLAQQIDYQGMKLDVMTGTYSGAHQVDDYLLLADGSIRKGWPEDVPLEDFDAAASKRAEPKRWGKYKARVEPGEGGFYDVVWADGEGEKLSLSFVVLARNDERLNGFFYRAGTAASNVAGASQTFASGWAGILFKPDGSFETSKGGSASYDSQANNPGNEDGVGIVATNKQSAQGRYRLSGSLLELRFDDGQVERRQFAFSSAEKDWIYVNGERLLLRK